MLPNYKPVGGVEGVILYPANAVESSLFSSEGCEVVFSNEGVEVELVDDCSSLEEQSEQYYGATKVTHRLTLVADRKEADSWLDESFIEAASIEGLIAAVRLCDGRTLLVGYSVHFEDEQPLRLESITYSSGKTLRDKPTLTLRLLSQDTEFSKEIL